AANRHTLLRVARPPFTSGQRFRSWRARGPAAWSVSVGWHLVRVFRGRVGSLHPDPLPGEGTRGTLVRGDESLRRKAGLAAGHRERPGTNDSVADVEDGANVVFRGRDFEEGAHGLSDAAAASDHLAHVPFGDVEVNDDAVAVILLRN